MRKLLILTFGLVLSMLLTASPVMAASPSVTINGTPVSFTDDSGYPFLDSANRAQVPLRATMEAFGCIVSWNAQTKTAIVEKDGMKVEVPIGQSYILKNGQQVYNDTVAVIKDNKTYLPIRVVLESFGAEVDWDQGSSSVIVHSLQANNLNDSNKQNSKVVDDWDVDLKQTLYTFKQGEIDLTNDLSSAEHVFENGVIGLSSTGSSYWLYEALLAAASDERLINLLKTEHDSCNFIIYQGKEYISNYDATELLEKIYSSSISYGISDRGIAGLQFREIPKEK